MAWWNPCVSLFWLNKFHPPNCFYIYRTATPVWHSLSSILAEFPWLSSNIVYNPKPLINPDLENEEYQVSVLDIIIDISSILYHLYSFFKALDLFETSLFQFNRNDNSISTLRLLGVALPEQDSHSPTACIISQHEHFLTVADYHKLGSLIAAYRFYEILGFRSGSLEPIPKDVARLSMFLPEIQRGASELHVSCYFASTSPLHHLMPL